MSCTASRAASASATIRRASGSSVSPAAVRVDGAADPLEQGRAEAALQGVNLLTQRGLRDAQIVRRLGEMSGLGHCQEVSELLQLHLDSLSL